MSSTMSVQNESGQVAHFSLDGPDGVARREVLKQRVARGELTEVAARTKTTRRSRTVVELDAGVRDEKGDLLKSIHGGGLDPDAAGDSLGTPTGSGISADQAAKDGRVAVAAVEQMQANAAESGTEVSATTESVKVAVEVHADQATSPEGKAAAKATAPAKAAKPQS